MSNVEHSPNFPVVVLGGGPAGLMAAEQLSAAGVAVQVFDAMPSVGRKFLMAGRGGLNLTHSEPLPQFISRYGAQADGVAPWLNAQGPQALRDWAAGLGIDTFVGTSGRVFPTDMKAAPLLRAWLQRLRQPSTPGAVPVRFHMRHRWLGFADGTPPAGAAARLRFEHPGGTLDIPARAVVLALGGASWPRLGSDGRWLAWLQARNIPVNDWQPANSGFDVWGRSGTGWTEFFAQRFAGQPLKNAVIRLSDPHGATIQRRGEFVITQTGVEGSLIYALSRPLREQLLAHGTAQLALDLQPDRSAEQVLAAVRHPRGRRSLGAHLKSRLGLGGVHSALLHELVPPDELAQPDALARAIKHLPIRLRAPRPVAEAISSAGGVQLQALDEHLMLRALPGVFCAGEMLDWEAPTGGYLLTAAMASGLCAGQGVLRWLSAAP